MLAVVMLLDGVIDSFVVESLFLFGEIRTSQQSVAKKAAQVYIHYLQNIIHQMRVMHVIHVHHSLSLPHATEALSQPVVDVHLEIHIANTGKVSYSFCQLHIRTAFNSE